MVGLLLLLCSCSRDPNLAKQKYLQSGQRYFDRGEYGRASIQFRKALQIDRQYAEAYYRLGLTDIKLQLWGDAFRSLDRATTLDPNKLPAHLKLGDLQLSAQQWEDARQQVAAALKLDSKNVDAYVLSGQVEFRSSHFRDAVQAFQQAERLAPKDSRAQAGLGEVNVVLQEYPQAEAHYTRAIELDPTFLPTYLNLAELYRMENQPDSAMRVLRQATANIAGGVVDSMMSLQGQAASFAGSSSFRVTPPCIGTPPECDSDLTFYVQSFGALGMGTISAQDDGTEWFWHHKHRHDPISEPASMALFGSGLAVLGGVIRRRLRLKLR